MRTKFWVMALALAVAAWGSLTLADHDPEHWAEVDDAGELLETAQLPEGAGPLSSITGTIAGGDGDMYGICITGGGDFSATTVGTPGTLSDTQLFAFDASGFGVIANDDTPAGGSFRSVLPSGHKLTPTEPGLYYLAISGYDHDPVSASGLIFPSEPFEGIFGPTGPGGADPISAWIGGSAAGTYTIALAGAAYLDLKSFGCPAK